MLRAILSSATGLAVGAYAPETFHVAEKVATGVAAGLLSYAFTKGTMEIATLGARTFLSNSQHVALYTNESLTAKTRAILVSSLLLGAAAGQASGAAIGYGVGNQLFASADATLPVKKAEVFTPAKFEFRV